MNFPVGLKYTQEHEWIKIEGDIAVVGITDFAQGELGDIVFVEVESIGKHSERWRFWNSGSCEDSFRFVPTSCRRGN